MPKDKPVLRAGKVQLIDASHCFEPRRKSIGTKRNDITDLCRNLIVQAYGEFQNDAIYGDKDGVCCHSKIFNTEDFGYYKIVVEQPERDADGKPVLKKGKPVADSSLRDTENVPMAEDIEEYFQREVLPYAPDAWQGYQNEKERQHSLVFTTSLGNHLSPQTVYNHAKKVFAQIGITDSCVHDLRHTYAVLSIQAEIDIKSISNNLGHATVAFTLDKYGHVTDSMRNESSSKMQALIDSLVS